MIKRSLTLALIPAAFYLNAQDITLIKNTAEVYTNPTTNIGTAKYNGMAGAMGALGGDISTINSNPAGLGVAITSDISATLNFDGNKSKSTILGNQKEYSLNNTNFGQVGGVLSFAVDDNSDWKFVNIGLNYSYQNLENYVETPANGTIFTDSSGDTITNLGHAYNRTGDLSRLNIGVGTNYNNNIYIGASLNFTKINLEQYDSQRFLLSSDDRIYDLNANYSPYSEDTSGLSLSAGIIAKLSNEVRVGAALETPTWWSMDRIFVSNNIDGNNIIARNYTEDRSLTTPMKMTLSGAFVPNKNFSINVDYALGLTKPKYKVQGEAEAMLNDFFNENYKNVSEVKVGAEYRLKNFRLRGGYGYASSPFDNNALIGKKHTIAGGIGYNFKSFYLDLAYQNITADYTNYYGGGYYFGNSFYLESNEVYSKVKNNRNTFFLTAGWKF